MIIQNTPWKQTNHLLTMMQHQIILKCNLITSQVQSSLRGELKTWIQQNPQNRSIKTSYSRLTGIFEKSISILEGYTTLRSSFSSTTLIGSIQSPSSFSISELKFCWNIFLINSSMTYLHCAILTGEEISMNTSPTAGPIWRKSKFEILIFFSHHKPLLSLLGNKLSKTSRKLPYFRRVLDME